MANNYTRYKFYVIGVGGTGSLLARDLPKLLLGTSHKMILVDGDTVESKNIERQGYQAQDVGDNKALVLSRKINSLYPIECEFDDKFCTYESLFSLIQDDKGYVPVIIGCVDNDATRMILEKVFKKLDDVIYIDSANSEYEGNIYINGEILEEDYGLETIQNPGRAAEPITLGEDEYFVLGDNRNNSTDSRTEKVGNVKRSTITGRAWVRIWPLSDFGVLKHQ